MHCIDIGIGQEWYEIASGIISTQLWPLIHVQNAFLLNILKMNKQISIKFCICIDIFIWSSFIQLHFAFPYFSTELPPLIYVQNVFLPNIFQINDNVSRKFCIVIGIVEVWYGIASGLNSLRNNRVMDRVKTVSPQIFRWIFYTQKAKAVFFSFCLVNNLCFQIAFELRRKLKGVAPLASPATCFSDTCMEEWWPLSCVKMCYPDSFRINGRILIGVWIYVRRPIYFFFFFFFCSWTKGQIVNQMWLLVL